LSDECFVYFHGDVIKKLIIVKNEYYYECQMNEETSKDRSVLLPKTNRGKEKKLTAATIQNRSRYGNYFRYDEGFITIANVTTQQTYFCSQMASANCEDMNQLQSWLDNWVSNSSEEYLLDIDNFSKAERMHCKFKEGDFFRFKIDRGIYGYGRILFNYDRLRKDKIPHWNILFGKPLIVKVYHIVTDKEPVPLEKLRELPALPSQYIMDNGFFYGEYEIVGNLLLDGSELDFPIMYGRSISSRSLDKIMFQRGTVYKEIPYSSETLIPGDFKYNSIGWGLDVTRQVLEACIREKSNQPYWNQMSYKAKGDLRNPQYVRERGMVLKQFEEG